MLGSWNHWQKVLDGINFFQVNLMPNINPLPVFSLPIIPLCPINNNDIFYMKPYNQAKNNCQQWVDDNIKTLTIVIDGGT
jgi:hypothetical protein